MLELLLVRQELQRVRPLQLHHDRRREQGVVRAHLLRDVHPGRADVMEEGKRDGKGGRGLRGTTDGSSGGKAIVLLNISYFLFPLCLFFFFVPMDGKDYQESRCQGVRVPGGLLGFALFLDDEQGTLAAHIYGRMTEERGSQEVGARNGGVYTDSLGQCLVTD